MHDQKWIQWMIFLIFFALCLSGCGGLSPRDDDPDAQADAPDPSVACEYPVHANGASLEERPVKVVSLAPALTEKLGDLGVADRIVGRSDYCDYPDAVLALPTCGTAQLPNLEEMLALAPDLVLTQSPLPDEVLEELEAHHIPVAIFPHAASIDELMQTYQNMARLMDGEVTGAQNGAAFEQEFQGRLTSLNTDLALYTAAAGRKNVLYLRLMAYTVATGDTFEQELFSMACMNNIAAPYTNWLYPEVDANSDAGKSDFALLDTIFMDEQFVTIHMLEQDSFYRTLPATKEDRYLYIDSLLLERQSLRTINELSRMAIHLYPEAAEQSSDGSGTLPEDAEPDDTSDAA